MQKRQVATQKIAHRPGDGHQVDFVVGATTGGSLSGSVDLSAAPVPERKFACDEAGLCVEPDGLRLLLAQKQPIGDELLSMLVINMSPESAAQFVASISANFFEEVRSLSPRNTAGRLVEFNSNAKQTVVLTSSFLMAGYSGGSACIDFFYASPFSVQNMAVLKKLSLEPVVRVNLKTGSLLALIDGIKTVVRESNWP